MRTVKIQRWLLLCFTLFILVCTTQGCCRLFNIGCEYPVELYMLYSVKQQIAILEKEISMDSGGGAKEINSKIVELQALEQSLSSQIKEVICPPNNSNPICNRHATLLDELDFPGPCSCEPVIAFILKLPIDNPSYRSEIISKADKVIPFKGDISEEFLQGGFTFTLHDINNQISFPFAFGPR